MKKFILVLFVLVSAFGKAQVVGQMGMFVPIDMPDRAYMPKMGVNGGIGLNLSYSPFRNSPVYLELKSSWGKYHYQTLTQTYSFDDGSKTTTDVNYSSGMSKYLLGAKVMVGRELWAVRGFVTPQIGFSKMKSKIYIEDPTDPDGCRALENRSTHKFTGSIYGGEVGLEIDLGRIIPSIQDEYTHKLVLTANFLGSFGHMEYVNVKYMENEVHDPNVVHDDRDINATFINVGSNALHEHKIAELYHTPLNMWGFSIGYTVNLWR
jgi:hypothetical protein